MQLKASINGQEVSTSSNTPAEVWNRRAIIGGLAGDLLAAVDAGGVEQVDCPVKHMFAPGVYIREIFMPEDTFIIGKIHKTSHFNEVISGECRVVTPASGKVEYYKAGDIFVSEAGVQKVVYNITDVVWRTVHVNQTNTQVLEQLEEICIAKDYDELPYDQLIEECRGLLCLGD